MEERKVSKSGAEVWRWIPLVLNISTWQLFIVQPATWRSLRTTLLWSCDWCLWVLQQVNLTHKNVSTLWSSLCLPVFCESEEFDLYLFKCSLTFLPLLQQMSRRAVGAVVSGVSGCCLLSDSCCVIFMGGGAHTRMVWSWCWVCSQDLLQSGNSWRSLFL